MNSIHLLCSNRYLAPVACLIGGYSLLRSSDALNKITNQFFYSSLPSRNEGKKEARNRCFTNILYSIRAELCYRFLWERNILPLIFPQLKTFSILRMTLSALIETLPVLSIYVDKNHLKKIGQSLRVGNVIRFFALVCICSIAQHKIGLVGSIFLRIGYNLYDSQVMSSKTLKESLQGLMSLKKEKIWDVVKIYFKYEELIKQIAAPVISVHQLFQKVRGQKTNS